MRLDSLRARGLGHFKGEVAIDLTKIDGLLVAVTGTNGAGKSTLLGFYPGLLHRATPRGPLKDLARERDSFVEGHVHNGRAWTITHRIDAMSGKGESSVLDDAGRPAFDSAKRKSFDAWAEKHLPPPALFYASMFTAQGGEGNILSLIPSKRKAVLLRAIGLEHYEELAALAGKRADARRPTIDRIRAELDRFRGGLSVAAAEAALADAQRHHAATDAAAISARSAFDVARESQAAAMAEEERVAGIRKLRDSLCRRSETLGKQLADVAERLKNNGDLLAKAPEILATAKRARDLAAERERVEGRLKLVGETIAGLITRRRGDEERVARARKEREAASVRVSTAARWTTVVAELEAEEGRLPALRQTEEIAELALRVAEEELARLGAERLSSAQDRIKDLRKGLEDIASGDPDPMSRAVETIDADDAAVKLGAEHPSKVTTAREGVAKARGELDAARRARSQLEARVARLPDARATLAAKAEHEAAEAEARRAEDAAAAAVAAAAPGISHHEGEQLQLLSRRDEILQELGSERVVEALKHEDRVATAQGRVAELEPQLAALERDRITLAEELAATPNPEDVWVPSVDSAKADLDRAVWARDHATGALSKAEAALAKAQETEAATAGLRAELAAEERRYENLTKLEADCGRNGLQALEIDDAAPNLEIEINELLRKCVSTRWTVYVELTREASDAKKQIECMAFIVHDSKTGFHGPAEMLSGGEKVIVGEAISLALTILAAKRSGVQGATLIRDESGAALAPENVGPYMAMLRAAAERTKAHQILVVSHQPEIRTYADAFVNLDADGTVTYG